MAATPGTSGLVACGLGLMLSGTAFPAAARAVRVESYVIDAVFSPAESAVHAVADVRFVPGTLSGDTLVFYLHGELVVDSVKVGAHVVAASQELVFHKDDYSLVANRIEVALSSFDLSRGLTIAYSGYFNPSVVSARSNYMRIDADGVYLRSLGYSLWFPVFVESWMESHEVSFPLVTIRTPADFRAVFAGNRVREYEKSGVRVSEWTADRLQIFDAQCTARRWDVSIGGAFHLYHLRDSSSGEMADEIMAIARRLESFYRANFRRSISAGQMHIMQMPKYGDISSGNVIGISDEVWRQFEPTTWQGRTVAHELVHPFVQPPCTDDMGAFVIEGFPGYFYLPALAEILGEPWYSHYMEGVESSYLRRRDTGRGRRGEILPPEIPILEIGYDEIGVYKDRFVLNDRVKLFFDYLRREMGKKRFLRFSSDLLNRDLLGYDVFVSVVETHLPGSGETVRRWLKTTDYPVEPPSAGR
jgi:hypothetical protein